LALTKPNTEVILIDAEFSDVRVTDEKFSSNDDGNVTFDKMKVDFSERDPIDSHVQVESTSRPPLTNTLENGVVGGDQIS
jgi:hypothetical protein